MYLESAQLCKAATTRNEVEEAIKAWLRRGKERAGKEENNYIYYTKECYETYKYYLCY